jgi:polysaccharide export outer membrane protein
MVGLLSAFLLGAAIAVKTVPTPGAAELQGAVPPQASPSPTSAPETTPYVVGSGDILEISVLDQPEVSRTTTVQTNGRFTMPLLGDIEVAGKTLFEIQKLVTDLLGRDFLLNPKVEVRVREYASQFVLVLGEVAAPGRKALRGNTRLIDILIEAGSFRPGASGSITIQRTEGTFPNGEKRLRFRLGDNPEMSEADRLNSELLLKNGDIVTASPKYYVIVDGEVGRPGRFVIEHDLTLFGVMAEAGGLGKFGSSKVRIIRKKAEDADLTGFGPCNGNQQDVCREIDIQDIRKGKVQDLLMAPNDKVIVSRRRF